MGPHIAFLIIINMMLLTVALCIFWLIAHGKKNNVESHAAKVIPIKRHQQRRKPVSISEEELARREQNEPPDEPA